MGRKQNQKSSDAGSSNKLSSIEKKELGDIVDLLLQKCTTFPTGTIQEWQEYLEIYNLVEKVRKLEFSYNFPLLNREDHISDFIKWLKIQGIQLDGIVSIEKFEDEDYGLKALKDFKTGQLILALPRKIMMTTDTAKSSKLGNFIVQDPILQNMPNVVLAMHLLCERCNPASFWTSYINILPDVFSTSLYFSPTQLHFLKGSSTLDESLKQFKNITRQYAYFFKQLQNNPMAHKLSIYNNFTFDNYRWAVSAVMTRQNFIPSTSGNNKINALIPLWDMINHSEGHVSTDFVIEKDIVECYSMREYKTNEQIFIFYGPRTNAEFFIHNGFVYFENDHNNVSIKLGLSKVDALYTLKMQVLSKLNICGSGFFKLYKSNRPLDKSLIAFMRVFHMEQDILEYWLSLSTIDSLMELDNASCKILDEKTCYYLKTRLSLLLKTYPTTIEEDEKILSSDIRKDDHPIIQMSLSEKLVFKNALEILEKGNLYI